jgi:hypothetical protein
MDEFAKIDMALDELLVSLGAMVLRLSSPAVSKTVEERKALARSVHQYAACARGSTDPRVRRLNDDLAEALGPRLRIVSSR